MAEEPLFRLLITDWKPASAPRWFWAIAKIAPSSFAVATLRPLLIALWVWSSWPWVAFKYCSATCAPVLVLTLKDMTYSPFHLVANTRSADLGKALAPAFATLVP